VCLFSLIGRENPNFRCSVLLSSFISSVPEDFPTCQINTRPRFIDVMLYGVSLVTRDW
jgi:hypothetical protein